MNLNFRFNGNRVQIILLFIGERYKRKEHRVVVTKAAVITIGLFMVTVLIRIELKSLRSKSEFADQRHLKSV